MNSLTLFNMDQNDTLFTYNLKTLEEKKKIF